MKNPKDCPKAPTELFLDACREAEPGHGSYQMDCNWCGREHLCVNVDWGWSECDEEDEKNWAEHCEFRYKESPDKVILHYDSDAVSGRIINGINFVLCCPCNGLSKYEEFIWYHRDVIRTYLKKRIDQETEFANQQKTMNKLAGIDNKVSREGTWI